MSFFEKPQVTEIFFALAILFLGTLSAFLIQKISYKILSRSSKLFTYSPLNLFTSEQAYSFVAQVSRFLFWVTLFYSLILALKPLGINFLEGFREQLTSYLPKLVTSVFVLFIGLFIARVASNLVWKSRFLGGVESSKNISRIIYAVLVSITALIVTKQLGIDVEFLTSTLLVILGCLLGGLAVSFGVGSASLVGSILATYYLRKVLKVGQSIEGEGYKGRVIEIKETAVLVQTESGIDVIPSKQMNNSRFRIINV